MDEITKTLKKSIAYERSKTDLTNLLNHNEPNLLLLIDAIEFQMRDYELELRIKERMIEESEDLSERVRANLNDSIAWLESRTQSLIAWRAIVFSACTSHKRTPEQKPKPLSIEFEDFHKEAQHLREYGNDPY